MESQESDYAKFFVLERKALQLLQAGKKLEDLRDKLFLNYVPFHRSLAELEKIKNFCTTARQIGGPRGITRLLQTLLNFYTSTFYSLEKSFS